MPPKRKVMSTEGAPEVVKPVYSEEFMEWLQQRALLNFYQILRPIPLRKMRALVSHWNDNMIHWPGKEPIPITEGGFAKLFKLPQGGTRFAYAIGRDRTSKLAYLSGFTEGYRRQGAGVVARIRPEFREGIGFMSTVMDARSPSIGCCAFRTVCFFDLADKLKIVDYNSEFYRSFKRNMKVARTRMETGKEDLVQVGLFLAEIWDRYDLEQGWWEMVLHLKPERFLRTFSRRIKLRTDASVPGSFKDDEKSNEVILQEAEEGSPQEEPQPVIPKKPRTKVAARKDNREEERCSEEETEKQSRQELEVASEQQEDTEKNPPGSSRGDQVSENRQPEELIHEGLPAEQTRSDKGDAVAAVANEGESELIWGRDFEEVLTRGFRAMETRLKCLEAKRNTGFVLQGVESVEDFPPVAKAMINALRMQLEYYTLRCAEQQGEIKAMENRIVELEEDINAG